MLHLELGLHTEFGTLLDSEGLVLESLDSTRGPEINGDVGTSFDLESQREDDAFAGIVGVGEVLARAKAERLLPLAEGFVVLIYRERKGSALAEVEGGAGGRRTQLLVLIESLLFADLETSGGLGLEVVVVFGRHCELSEEERWSSGDVEQGSELCE